VLENYKPRDMYSEAMDLSLEEEPGLTPEEEEFLDYWFERDKNILGRPRILGTED
tara:strand:- start:268 stop:432 length:165 start_codon:yes stop_codon:yes gene_type:complete